MTKLLALYLPQFHQIPENDVWWGEGFTEWNVVKKATSLNKHSSQPKIPLMGYYDLSKKESIKQQVELANNYGIDGFVIYSYYSNGKTLLETPSRIILDNTDINISFCFSWANHDWLRTWFSYNRELLRKQEYASDRKQIAAHFEYYLPYFKDDRYIKIDNKPVLFIYDYESIPDFSLYRMVFNQLAIENGFDGVFFVQTLGGHHLSRNPALFEAFFEYEPTYTTFSDMKNVHRLHRLKRAIKKVFKGHYLTNIFKYDDVCTRMEKRPCDPFTICGSFAEWDNTPRHNHNGTVFSGFSIARFKKNLLIQLNKAKKSNSPFVVIDAWNEWGEGAFLEPDVKYSFQKLEAIRSVVNECDYNN